MYLKIIKWAVVVVVKSTKTTEIYHFIVWKLLENNEKSEKEPGMAHEKYNLLRMHWLWYFRVHSSSDQS